MAPKEQGSLEPQQAVKAKPRTKNKNTVLAVEEDPVPDPRKQWRFILFACAFSILAQILMILALVIAGYIIYMLVVLPSITNNEAGRKAGLVIIILNNVVIFGIFIQALHGFRKYKISQVSKVPFLAVLAVVTVLQLCAISVAVFDENQELSFAGALQKDFQQSRVNDLNSLKFYHKLEYSLHCCGVVGPESYRPVNFDNRFPPDVPISCCPSYDPDLSDMEQNKARQICKLNRSYYTQGCMAPAIGHLKKLLHPLFVMLLVSNVMLLVLISLGLVGKFCGNKIIRTNDDKPNP